ncbi:hypothetical protein Taro_030223 [Colocasia esculenta]|uniref:Uncharacterized protein n=1 Tax=Colocasia esculenta TaxID=4460 RepID=A0A843W2P9_COLES|nr:hypothetical protein [Colocasia esculenta]
MSSAAVVPLLLLCAAAAPASSAARIFPSKDAAAFALSQQDGSGSVHDLLPGYGLPPGLLPASVKDYSMDSNGQFTVRLAAPCYIQFTELVYYDRTIKGKISYGSITDLSGIQVKKLFAWLPVTGMVAVDDGSSIEFQVGFLSEKLPTSMFAEIPSCRKKASSSCHGAGAAVSTLETA